MILSEVPLFPAESLLCLVSSDGRPSIWQAALFQTRGQAAIRFTNVRRQNVAMALRPEELADVALRRGALCLKADASREVIARWMLGTHFFDPRADAQPGEDLLLPSEAPKPLDERPRRPPNF